MVDKAWQFWYNQHYHMPSCVYPFVHCVWKGSSHAKKRIITLIDPEAHLDNEGIMITLALVQFHTSVYSHLKWSFSNSSHSDNYPKGTTADAHGLRRHRSFCRRTFQGSCSWCLLFSDCWLQTFWLLLLRVVQKMLRVKHLILHCF